MIMDQYPFNSMKQQFESELDKILSERYRRSESMIVETLILCGTSKHSSLGSH